MKKTTDIWLYIIVGLMCAALLLAIATAIYGIINPSYEYERGYILKECLNIANDLGTNCRDGYIMKIGRYIFAGGEE